MPNASRNDKFENFYFTVDDCAREDSFGINRHKWDLDPDHHSERDEIIVAGRLARACKGQNKSRL